MSAHVIPLENLRNTDVGSVGGKNASLGEMISQLNAKGVRVPTGFATTALAFREFLSHNKIDDKIAYEIKNLNKIVSKLLGSGGSKKASKRKDLNTLISGARMEVEAVFAETQLSILELLNL